VVFFVEYAKAPAGPILTFVRERVTDHLGEALTG
jgi:hypothetical protein